MGSFTRAIGAGGIGGGRLDVVTGLLEKIANLRTVTKFATHVATNVFALDCRGKAMNGKPTVTKVDGRSFGPKGLPMESTTKVINDQDIAGLTIEACETLHARSVFGALYKEADVNGDALVTLCGIGLGIFLTACSFLELSLGTD